MKAIKQVKEGWEKEKSKKPHAFWCVLTITLWLIISIKFLSLILVGQDISYMKLLFGE